MMSKRAPNRGPVLLLTSILLVLVGSAAPALAQPQDTTLTGGAAGADGEEPAPWRGSAITVRNAATALTFQEDAEPTYNPYYAIRFDATPRWWFGRHLYVGVDFGFEAEITDSDTTTRRNEVLWDDTLVRFGASRFVTIPGAGIDFSLGLDLVTPTSKVSQARTLYVGLRPSVTVSRHFDWLGGIDLAYLFRATKSFNEYTTGELDGPIVPGCSGSASECASLLQTGLRNPSWTLTHLLVLNVGFTDWIGVAGTAGFVTSYLYPLEGKDDRLSLTPQETTDERYTMVYEVELWTRPLPSLGISVGASTVNPQLTPDAGYERPFFNRYTTVYVDLRLDVAGLVAQIMPGQEPLSDEKE